MYKTWFIRLAYVSLLDQMANEITSIAKYLSKSKKNISPHNASSMKLQFKILQYTSWVIQLLFGIEFF